MKYKVMIITLSVVMSFINVLQAQEKEVFILRPEVKFDQRTSSGLFLAAGLNTFSDKSESYNDTDFELYGSRFFEFGWLWTTRVFKNSNVLRLRYGISYQSNGVRSKNDQIFVYDGEQTLLSISDKSLSKSKFRVDNLTIPFYLEVGPSKDKTSRTSINFDTSGRFKLGIGGFVGATINTMQKIKYETDEGDKKYKLKNDLEVKRFVYGIGTYIGFGSISLYGKYDFSSVFEKSIPEYYNVSLGLRYDM
ncbi:hypothetical protein [Aquimarina intermedia]|uniref:Outer membrane protein with beta-barrel domain n=1 Tax=Aquimarina intermedia TaxID=350814 RepID=A0A5S5C9M5_9FLAO|nr:hypothetical protein [Aquimarina intermedia]TYP75869.1 hypothetical protein BD809_10277 [Aquimarina intermedia]